MKSTINKQTLLERAMKFRDNHSVDVVALANDLGIKVFLSDDPNLSGQINFEPKHKEFSILVNHAEPLTRQRFSVAHELSHFILHKNQLMKSGCLHRQTQMTVDVDEKAADKLAAEILMPEQIVHEYIKESHIDVKKLSLYQIISMAKHFKVSNFVATIRLRELGFYVPFVTFS